MSAVRVAAIRPMQLKVAQIISAGLGDGCPCCCQDDSGNPPPTPPMLPLFLVGGFPLLIDGRPLILQA